MDLVVGVDAGGTASRAVVATVAGAIVGRGLAGPGNPLSGGASATVRIGAAIRAALSDSDPSEVSAGVLGVAGTSGVDRVAFADMWSSLGLRAPFRIVGDVVTAFAAGTASPSGAALIAGTGAVAARITGHEITEVADGLGWLLGDEGSGRWIGLQSLRYAVREWSSPLAAAVATHTGTRSADALVRWAQALPLAAIDALAPIVCAAARAGDPAAVGITADAVTRLLTTLDAVTPAITPAAAPSPGPDPAVPPAALPVVLGGGLLAADTPVRAGVLTALRARGVTIGTSHDPAAAAAWLAARDLGAADPSGLHAVLVGR